MHRSKIALLDHLVGSYEEPVDIVAQHVAAFSCCGAKSNNVP